MVHASKVRTTARPSTRVERTNRRAAEASYRSRTLVIAGEAPPIVGLIGNHRVHLWGDVNVRADGVTFVLLGGGLLAMAVGLFAYRQMDDHSGVPVLPELWNALRGRNQARRPASSGLTQR